MMLSLLSIIKAIQDTLYEIEIHAAGNRVTRIVGCKALQRGEERRGWGGGERGATQAPEETRDALSCPAALPCGMQERACHPTLL